MTMKNKEFYMPDNLDALDIYVSTLPQVTYSEGVDLFDECMTDYDNFGKFERVLKELETSTGSHIKWHTTFPRKLIGSVDVPSRGDRYVHVLTGLTGVFHSKAVSLTLAYDMDHKCIDLFLLSVNRMRKGLGTKMMEHIFDAADNQGIDVRILPAPHYGAYGQRPMDGDKLRAWYLSFDGVEPDPDGSPYLIYRAQPQ